MGCHLLIAKSDAWSMTIIRTFVTWIFFSAFHANLLCEHLLNGVSSAFGINIPLLCHTTSIVSYPGINRGNLFSYSARLSCSRVYLISGNTQSVSAIAGSLSHIVYDLQDLHSSWPTSFGSIIINSPLCQESHCRSNVSMQTSVSVHPRTDCPWTYPESYLAGLRRTGKLI